MVQILPSDNKWQQYGEGLQSGVQSFYDQSDQNALQSTVSKLPETASARDILDAITNTRTHSPKAKQQVLENLIGAKKIDQMQKDAAQQADYKRMETDLMMAKERKSAELQERRLTIDEDKNKIAEQKNQLKETEAQTKKTEKELELIDKKNKRDALINALPEEVRERAGNLPDKVLEQMFIKSITPKDEKMSDAEKAYSKLLAKEYYDNTKDLSSAQSDLAGLDDIEALVKEGTFVAGWFGGGKAKELNAMTLPYIKLATKVLAPSGPIIKAKMDIAKDALHVQATDPKWQQEGKIRAIKFLLNSSIKRMEKRNELIMESDFRLPKNAVKNYDKETADELQAIIDMPFEGNTVQKEDIPANFPSPQVKKGKTLINKETGQKFYSNGEKWIIKK